MTTFRYASKPVIKVLKLLAFIFGGLLFLLTLASAYGGEIDPRTSAFPAVLHLLFLPSVIMTLVITLVSLAGMRRLSVAGGITLLLTLPMLLTYCPIHFSDRGVEVPEGSTDTFSVLTYNTYYFNSYKGVEDDSAAMVSTVEHILDSNAGIVVMQEGRPYDPFEMGHEATSPSLAAAVRSRYPYRSFAANAMCVMSRYPMKVVRMHYPTLGESSFMVACYEFTIGSRQLRVINVHLQSFHIKRTELSSMLSLSGVLTRHDEARRARALMLPRVSYAFRMRALQVDILAHMINGLPDMPTVVCGDFNDVPGSYVVRTLVREAGLRDCYMASAFGYSRTYRLHGLWFHIDQMFCNDMLEPLCTRTIAGGSSDHYPVLGVFEFDKK